MKKRLFILLTVLLALCFCSCKDQNETEMIPEVEIDSGMHMSQDLYESIQNEDWSHMTVADFNSFFGFEGVLDIQDTEKYGEGYQVYRYYGMTEDVYLTIVFKDVNENGEYIATDMKPSKLN